MSLLDKLNIGKDKRKAKMPLGLNYLQQQEWKRAQARKQKAEIDERTAKIGKVDPVERECPVCERPMKVAVGQLMFRHKECKGKYKRALARSR